MSDLKRFLTTNPDGPEKALDLAFNYGQIDGDHHKLWTIDQMVRALTGEHYEKFINFYRFAPDEGEEGDRLEADEYPETDSDGEEREELYSWEEGGAP